MTQPPIHTHAATHAQVRETELASGDHLREPLTVVALFDDPEAVDRTLDALYTAGTPRDLIQVVVSRQAAERHYAGARGRGAPRPPGRETWRFAGVGALVGFLTGVLISLVTVAWPGIEAPGGLALAQFAGPNFCTVLGAGAGAIVGALRRQQPDPALARAAESSNAIVVGVASRGEREAQLLAQLIAGQGGRDVRVETAAPA